MKCDMKTMIKILLGLGVALAVAYIALPEARTLIGTMSPLLLVLVCPLAMGIMMLVMKGEKPKKLDETASSTGEPGKDRL